MLFKPELIAEIKAGRKTQTRRVVKLPATGEGINGEEMLCYPGGTETACIYRNGHWCIKWQVGRVYAICSGRGKSGVGFIRLTAIRQERVQDISTHDVQKEGCRAEVEVNSYGNLVDGYDFGFTVIGSREVYAELWDSINTRKGTRWQDNPEVWVLTFEYVGETRP